MPKALGLIETRGLVAAIEAADTMVKTSNVTLIGKEIIRSGLVTIKIVGEVAAVKASVDAGAAAAKKVGIVVSTHVIAQPDTQIEALIPEIRDDDKKTEKKQEQIKPAETQIKTEPEPGKKTEPEIKPNTEIKTKADKPKPVVKSKPEIKKDSDSENIYTDHLEKLRMEALGIKSDKAEQKNKQITVDLEKMNVHQLRKQARETEGFPIQGRDISKANRQELLDYFKKIS